MKIHVTNIKINSISTNGSLNIGKTILTRNQSVTENYIQPSEMEQETLITEPSTIGEVQSPSAGEFQTPVHGLVPIPAQVQAPRAKQ